MSRTSLLSATVHAASRSSRFRSRSPPETTNLRRSSSTELEGRLFSRDDRFIVAPLFEPVDSQASIGAFESLACSCRIFQKGIVKLVIAAGDGASRALAEQTLQEPTPTVNDVTIFILSSIAESLAYKTSSFHISSLPIRAASMDNLSPNCFESLTPDY